MTMEIQARMYPYSTEDVAKSQEALEHFRGVLEGMGVNTQYNIPVITTEEPYPPNWNRTDLRTVVKIEGHIHFNDGKSSWCGFGAALAALKSGKKVARAGWNGKGMFIYLTPPSLVDVEKIHRPQVLIDYAKTYPAPSVPINGHIDMKAADGTIVIGWLASQTDLLAEDWMVVE